MQVKSNEYFNYFALKILPTIGFTFPMQHSSGLDYIETKA